VTWRVEMGPLSVNIAGKTRGVPRLPMILSFCLLAVAGAAAVISALGSNQAEQWLDHSLKVRQVEAQLFSAVQDAETGQRGYLLTGGPTYLKPYLEAKARIGPLQTQLMGLIQDHPRQQARLASLSGVIGAKIAELDQTVALRQRGRESDALALVRSDRGQHLMQQIRADTEAFDATERQLLQDRQDKARALRTVLAIIIPISVLVAALLAAFVARAVQVYERALLERNQALATEMDQREKAETQLRQAQKMDALGQLTGGVAHDFNNMLAIIVGNLDILIRRLGPADDRLKPTAENALNGARRAAALTKRLLAFSRLQPLAPTSTDVNKCVGDMSEMLRRTLGEKIVVETVLAGGLWRGFVDCPQLESAVLNLAVNARDAMPEGGKLTLETSNASLDRAYAAAHGDVEAGQYVMVAVTDTGNGMAAETIAKAFDPFFTTKGVGEGTGLGLSQVHGFLKQSKGHVKIYSEVGVGTTVKLYLPRDTSGRMDATPVREFGVEPIDPSVTVLVVEDDPGVRHMAVGALRELGYAVLEADSAAMALERLDQHPNVTVLLTDVVMPVMDGRRLVDAALVRRPDLRVLFMTGYTRNAIVHNGVLDPGIHLITKPFTMEELDREMRLILRAKS
jgi:signal transduction histidine kinase